MSRMNEIERNYCREFLDKILKHPLSICYLRPVNPEIDEAKDYFDIITEPMDLGKINARFNENYYITVEDFKKDINLVWTNSMTYLKKKTHLLYQVAQHMKDKCDKLLSNIPKTKEEEWSLKMMNLDKQLRKLLSNTIPQESIVPRNPEYAIK